MARVSLVLLLLGLLSLTWAQEVTTTSVEVDPVEEEETAALEGRSGFPVFVDLQVPDDAEGETIFVVTALPVNGGLFTNDVPIQLVMQEDVDAGTAVTSPLAYVSNMGFSGTDEFSYVVVETVSGDTVAEETVTFEIDMSPPPNAPTPETPVTDAECQPDICGVCHGDGSSCTGGCDNRGGSFDICGVCNGDNSTCSCAVFKTFPISDMDCVLFEYSINRTLSRLEYVIENLAQSLSALGDFQGWNDAEFDLGIQIDVLNIFSKECIPPYIEDIDTFLFDLNSRQIEAPTEPCPPAYPHADSLGSFYSEKFDFQ